MAQLFAYVNDASLQGAADGSSVGLQATKRGELRIQDFWTNMAIQGRVFQIANGNIATGVAMSNAIQSAKAEACVDAVAGTTIIPAQFTMSADDIATALTVKVRIAAVGVVSSAGTAATPLNLRQGGSAAVSTARVANNAGVTVTAETLLITRQLFNWSNVETETPATDKNSALVSLSTAALLAFSGKAPYIGVGPACIYMAAGAGTAFPLYFFSLNYVEIPTANL